MHFMDLHPYFEGLEKLVTVDEEHVSYMTPHQPSIIRACQDKFCLSPEVWLFSPDQVYVVLMERCPLWVHGRELGKRLYGVLRSRMSDPDFSKTEQGLFTWLAIALQQEVYVAYCMGQLQPIGQTSPLCSAVLDRLDLVSDESTGLSLWQAQFCIENYEIVQEIGTISYLTTLFLNPRPIPVNYLRPTIRADQQASSSTEYIPLPDRRELRSHDPLEEKNGELVYSHNEGAKKYIAILETLTPFPANDGGVNGWWSIEVSILSYGLQKISRTGMAYELLQVVEKIA